MLPSTTASTTSTTTTVPAGQLGYLSLVSIGSYVAGQRAVLTVASKTASLAALPNVAFTVKVTGVHAQSISGQTDSSGSAIVRYQGSVVGQDSISVSSGSVSSGESTVDWSSAIQLTSPVDQVRVRGSQPLTATLTAGVSGPVEFLVDGTVVGTSTGPPFTFSWDSTSIPDGPHTITARISVDGVVLSNSASVVVDNIKTPLRVLEADYKAGALSVDDYALYAINYVVNGSLPQKYVSLVPVGFRESIDVPGALVEFFGLPMSASRRALLVSSIGGGVDPATVPVSNDVETLGPLPVVVSDASGLPGWTSSPSASDVSAAVFAAGLNPTGAQTIPSFCKQLTSGSRVWWTCEHRQRISQLVTPTVGPSVGVAVEVPDLIVRYSVFNTPDSVETTNGTFADDICFSRGTPTPVAAQCHNGVPDEIDRLQRGAADALSTYLEMGYQLDAALFDKTLKKNVVQILYAEDVSAPIPQVGPIPFSSIPIDSPAWVSPFGYHLIRFKPSAEPQLIRHEVAHIFQWYYTSLDQDYLGGSGWWMEATANWLEHKTIEKQCPGGASVSVGFTFGYPCNRNNGSTDIWVDHYSGSVGRFMQPDAFQRRLDPKFNLAIYVPNSSNSGVSLGYSHFLLAEWLEERYGPDFIRKTFDALKPSTNPDAEAAIQLLITQNTTTSGTTETFDTILNDFWAAAYRLNGTDGQPGFSDPHAIYWRSNLLRDCGVLCQQDSLIGQDRPGRDKVGLTPGGKLSSQTVLFKGGAVHVDVTAASLPATYDVTFSANQKNVVARVLSWPKAGTGNAYPATGNCGVGQAVGSSAAIKTIRIELTIDCPLATVVLSTISPDQGNRTDTDEASKNVLSATFHRLMISTNGYAAEVLKDNPVRYYRFNDPNGTYVMTDSSISKMDGETTSFNRVNAGALSNKVVDRATSGPIGSPLAYASPNGLPTGASARTIEMWVNAGYNFNNPFSDLLSYGDYPSNSFRIFLKSSQIYVDPDGQGPEVTQFVQLSGPITTAGSNPYTPSSTGWSQVVVTYDGNTTIKVYVNGSIKGSLTLTGKLDTQTQGFEQLVLGGPSGAQVALDEVAIYPTALTDARIMAHYKASGR
jgi:Concanavalin A-like lectin/glucanases superfamily/Bacterial Ig domain